KTLSVLGRNPQVFEESEHVLPDRFIVFINQAPILGFASGFPLTDTSENRTENLFAENDQCSDNTDGLGWDGISARVAQLGEEILGPELFQVVSGSACIVLEKGCVSHRLHGGGEVTDGESTWSTS